MNASLVFTELLVGGLQVYIWIAFFLGGLTSIEKVSKLVRDIGNVEIVFIFAFAYVLGTIFDRIWDAVLSPFDKKVRIKVFSTDENCKKIRLKFFLNCKESQMKLVDYIRIRVRLTRATVCNLAMVIIGWNLIVATNPNTYWMPDNLYITSLLGSFMLLACFSYGKLLYTYYQMLKGLGN